jgi:hypothetical protein
VDCGLFVTDQNMFDRVLGELVINVDDRTPGKPENEINPFPLQTLH